MDTGRVQLTSMSKHPENHIVWFSPLDYGNSIKKKRNSFQRVEKPQFQSSMHTAGMCYRYDLIIG